MPNIRRLVLKSQGLAVLRFQLDAGYCFYGCPRRVGTNGMLFCCKSNKYNEFWSTDTENRPNVYIPLPGLSLFHTDTQPPLAFSRVVGGNALKDLTGNRAKVAGIYTRVLAVTGQSTWQRWLGSREVPRGVWGLEKKKFRLSQPFREAIWWNYVIFEPCVVQVPTCTPIKALLFTWAALQALGLTLQPWPQEKSWDHLSGKTSRIIESNH